MQGKSDHCVIFSWAAHKDDSTKARKPASFCQHPTNHNTTNDDMKQEWRRYGAARRKELVEKDEKQGGTRFELHKKCNVEQYFKIADRVRVARPYSPIEYTKGFPLT